MYSLPSTSHTWQPLPRCRNLGETPSTNCDGALLSVCVPPGITRCARSHRRSDSVTERVTDSVAIRIAAMLALPRSTERTATAREPPAVDDERLAGDIRRRGRGEERDR